MSLARIPILIILIDGLGDVSVKSIGGNTPLSHHVKPAMDYLSSIGVNGLIDPYQPGYACGSDTANLNLLGYNSETYYRGRGVLEALGAGVKVFPGDVSFKCNFSYLSGDVVVKRRADRDFPEGEELCTYLQNNISLPKMYKENRIVFKYATEHRLTVCIKGPSLSREITDTDPKKDGLKVRVSKGIDENDPRQVYTSRLVNYLSGEIHKLLEKHPINEKRRNDKKYPANIVLFRGAGSVPDYMENINNKHEDRRKSFMIAPTCVIRGIGILLGMEILCDKELTGDYKTNIEKKGVISVEKLNSGDYWLGYLHIKAVDDCGHDGDLDRKIDFIKRIDKMVEYIIKNTKTPFLICITGDHSTPVYLRDHSSDPVPILVAHVDNSTRQNGFGAFCDGVCKFDEISAARGSLGRFKAINLMNLLISLSEKLSFEISQKEH